MTGYYYTFAIFFLACISLDPCAAFSPHKLTDMGASTAAAATAIIGIIDGQNNMNHKSMNHDTNRSGSGRRNKSFGWTRCAAKKRKVEEENEEQQKKAMDVAKRAALDGVLQKIEKSYGRGSVVKLGDSDKMKIDCTPSGALTLDAALGGGYPKGRIIEIYGPESSGKTTLALHAIAECQKQGGIAAFVDAEHALDPAYSEKLGVQVDDLFVSQPDSGEMALDIVDQLVRSAAVDIIVVDSVAALVPRAELEGDMSDQQIGLQARLMSKALRKITGSLSLSKCTVIFINQLRSKVGVFYGSSEVTAGGNALKFYSSVRLDTRRREVLPENAGIRMRVKVVKNKVAAPFKEVMLDVLFGSGIDSIGCLVDAASDAGIVVRKGSWYSYNNINFAQGRHNAAEHLRTNKELCELIEQEVIQNMSTTSTDPPTSSQESNNDDDNNNNNIDAEQQQSPSSVVGEFSENVMEGGILE
eukprot:CAMPEP_0197833252 /NCGR_PEP_ID=MMETSP1437-20131217/18359_1 /TAXON_ID=49252 ORGANISM="Eucampia antarctica, Strain CCMP1452" /NCGR_SAMPLE_ID=MMETSP1437 /ASSEMBLY_ACC=CAM_ASM_001096 /LENGTH=470 /DNA_ID=CAMNT_0043437209 /DNA_START=52 /DNA_END=1464 /DNA_ORIENTATION=-